MIHESVEKVHLTYLPDSQPGRVTQGDGFHLPGSRNGNIESGRKERGRRGRSRTTEHNKQSQDVGSERGREKEKLLVAGVSVFVLKQLGKIIHGEVR